MDIDSVTTCSKELRTASWVVIGRKAHHEQMQSPGAKEAYLQNLQKGFLVGDFAKRLMKHPGRGLYRTHGT